MTHVVLGHSKDGHHTGTVSQTVSIGVPSEAVWKEISNIAGLAGWVAGVKKAEFLSKVRRGLGASRRILFDDGGNVIEYVTGWENGKFLSYIATEGLPLGGYHATLSIAPRGKSTHLTWTSFLISSGPDRREFEEFLAFMDSFYKDSLASLKSKLEKAT